ncbi:MAG: tRNA pseudouridine(38-40) synthase TruA [Piscinibacter sp.]|uniref:tRNA pseudouridine(38-40) synthase TruA n=1 Tax=Piscinibacter sp. TaxID=1903157 RepID=UPI001B463B68|nr:tRNA pseudouridine(38-40) synthase TruA [Piscinibacter sp.]MBP5992140.1 tRNA pseudouridine(38-40) synthase TruA [Piscinibacter sp.]MBP6029225.1 tRNA pseudouridine(38-40) synthase TruA [Piscinibacter sp.]
MRVALGVSYRGSAYQGWQSQPGGQTVQDRLEAALAQFLDNPVRVMCAGRTDAGVHALNQVVHLDTDAQREPFSWVRGTNRFLPDDIALQWCRPVDERFHARNSALGRRYVYVMRESPVRPALEAGLAGWSFRALDGEAMQAAAQLLIGEHDFSAFRSAECQAASPVKTLRRIHIERRGAYWRFEFEASAFLHHMVRNILGCLVAVGAGTRDARWLAGVLAARDRSLAAPTFPADGLYFVGPYYDPSLALPESTAAMDWLP